MKMIIFAVIIAWTNDGSYTKDSTGVQIFNEIDDCLLTVQAFALKHKIKMEKCVKMPLDKYNKTFANKLVTFKIGKEWPIAGGHICKKNRKGKLYSCHNLKDTTK